ncbi:PfkB family carbohydrate kinase [Sphingomonas aquatilis]|uniref:PfkB family carbohydrate kinase n=1 Tax=Sphingomonas aquatilis TaxID=93063 RepID=UPI0023FA210B|nr:PfkB family carbohydrate kinase [Sphingomonas aquatilis]MCI4652593.1 PfkB family carbohydrate kinase [Sphingomonas aquatilis]
MAKIDVVGTGFTVLDRVYVGSLDVSAEDLGGSCGNVLISLAMLRRNVAPVLRLGEDEVGVRLVGAFQHAGAETRYIYRHTDVRSPVLAQHLHAAGAHTFTFRCPETDVDLPRYQPIDQVEVERALPAIRSCAVFYADRLSDAIVEAMEAASSCGSVVYFEPSEIGDEDLFRRALAVTAVLKFSAERLAALAGRIDVAEGLWLIVTHGEAGLEVRRGDERHWSRSHPAPEVRDTCGSGDMVSVGVIDWLLARRRRGGGAFSLKDFVRAVEAGQRLAAENCAYVGARGLFRERGAEYARTVLEG